MYSCLYDTCADINLSLCVCKMSFGALQAARSEEA